MNLIIPAPGNNCMSCSRRHVLMGLYRCRYVHTKSFRNEQMLRRRISRGHHDAGSLDNPNWLLNPFNVDFKQPANHSVLLWAGKMFAFSESGVPYELNKMDLDTLGEAGFKGRDMSANVGSGSGASLSGNYKVWRLTALDFVVLVGSRMHKSIMYYLTFRCKLLMF